MERILRSSAKKNNAKIMPEYEVNIDFDESSRLWNENKKKTSSGLYKYICDGFTKTSKKCERVCQNNTNYCYQHRNVSNVN